MAASRSERGAFEPGSRIGGALAPGSSGGIFSGSARVPSPADSPGGAGWGGTCVAGSGGSSTAASSGWAARSQTARSACTATG